MEVNMTANKLMKRADTRDKRLKKMVWEAFTTQLNEDIEKEKKRLKNPFYRLYKMIKRLFVK